MALERCDIVALWHWSVGDIDDIDSIDSIDGSIDGIDGSIDNVFVRTCARLCFSVNDDDIIMAVALWVGI